MPITRFTAPVLVTVKVWAAGADPMVTELKSFVAGEREAVGEPAGLMVMEASSVLVLVFVLVL